MKSLVSLKSERIQPDNFDSDYDLAIFVSSYESRCVRSSNYDGLRFKHGLAVLFSQMKTTRPRIRHDSIIKDKIYTAHASSLILRPSVYDYASTTKDILSAIASKLDPTKANRIFVDITTCPKYYFAAILSQLFLSGYAVSYTFFYAEGRYTSDKTVIPFTESEWTLHTIPGLEGRFDPTLGRGFLLSVGFESPKVRRLVSRYLPDSIVLLEANPGFNDEYTIQARDAAQQVLDFSGTAAALYLEGQNAVVAPAGDGAAAYNALDSALNNGFLDIGGFNWTLVPCGPKPHALAMILFALTNPNCCFAYPAPQRYGVYQAEPTGVDWVYDVTDKSLLFIR